MSRRWIVPFVCLCVGFVLAFVGPNATANGPDDSSSGEESTAPWDDPMLPERIRDALRRGFEQAERPDVAPGERAPETEDRASVGAGRVRTVRASTQAPSSPPPSPSSTGSTDDPYPPVTDVASDETLLSEALPARPATDTMPVVFGRPNGEVVVLTLEAFTLYAFHSSDGGATFGDEVAVAGPPVGERVHGFRATLAKDGTLYVLLTEAAPSGGIALRAYVSRDAGRTWRPPVTIADSNDGLGWLTAVMSRFDTAPDGRATVTFMADAIQRVDLWAVSTADHGESWTVPFRLTDASPFGGFQSDVAIDPDSGAIYVAFTQTNETYWYYFRTVVRRSLDGGATFEPAIELEPSANSFSQAEGPDIEITGDGVVLVADEFGSYYGDAGVRVFRSVDGGETFDLAQRFDHYANRDYPQMLTSPDDESVVLLLVAEGDYDPSCYCTRSAMQVRRSDDGGVTFGAPEPIVDEGWWWDSQVRPRRKIVRTPSGMLAVIWVDLRDRRTEPAPGTHVAVRVFRDEVWEEPVRINGRPIPGSEVDPWLAAVGDDRLFGLWLEADRPDGLGASVHANRFDGASGAFEGARRVDRDHTETHPGVRPEGARIYSDGVGHAYALLLGDLDGTGDGLWVRVSEDAGRTFGPAVRVDAASAGESVVLMQSGSQPPKIVAFPDGTVYAAWLALEGYDRVIRFERSTDFGVTWSDEGTVLGFAAASPDIAATSDGRVFVTWGNRNVVLATSTDHGATFTQETFIGGRARSAGVSVCARDRTVALVWADYTNGGWIQLFGVLSSDGGDHYSPVSDISTFETSPYSLSDLGPGALACGVDGAVAVTWSGFDGTPPHLFRVFVARRDGDGWAPPSALLENGVPWSRSQPVVAYPDDAGVVGIVAPIREVSESSYDYGFYFLRSTDGGETFGPATRLDDPTTFNVYSPTNRAVATLGDGTLWIAWTEEVLPGSDLEIRMVRSDDGGATFGSVRRVNRDVPRGFLRNEYPSAAALPGVGLFAWCGEREEPIWQPLFNADDVDDPDRDGHGAGSDCDDADPDVYPGAPEICDGKNNDCDDPAWPALPASEGDPDDDGLRTCEDNCPEAYNPGQEDEDGDGTGDACENTPPVADAGPNRVLECTGDLGATTTLDGSASYDPDPDDAVASYAWSEGETVLSTLEVDDVFFGLGDHEVVLTVEDGRGATDSDSVSVRVEDTVAPGVSIVAPAPGACLRGPVTVEVDATDTCDPELDLAFDPEPGPTYDSHGDRTVAVSATDEVGLVGSDAVSFTIDTLPPSVAFTIPVERRTLLPSTLPFEILFASSDDDGASGGVVHERLLLDGCPAFDGASHGDKDGLLSDEDLALDLGTLCGIAERCGFGRLVKPVLRIEASDCAGNVGADEIRLGGSIEPFPGVCTIKAGDDAGSPEDRAWTARRPRSRTAPRR